MAQIDPDIHTPVEADDHPVAIRRKRRCSTALADAQQERNIQPRENSFELPSGLAKTPSKPKKRVRFSDPGPDLSAPSSSTGLTPFVHRTSFISHDVTPVPISRRLRTPLHKRLSLPNLHSGFMPYPSLSPSPGPLSGEFRFAPLRQVVGGRTMRRIRRNHLSEEMNEIDAERKFITHLKEEVQQLRDDSEKAKQLGNQGKDSQDKLVLYVERIRELEQEISEVKTERREQSTGFEPGTPNHISYDPPTPNSGVHVDDTAENYEEIDSNNQVVLRDRTPSVPPTTYSQAATQASLRHPGEAEMLRSARLSLEYLFPGEIALGLIPDDPQPILDIMLERLQTLKSQVLIAEDALSTTQTQESNLRTQFNAVLQQLDRARKYAAEAHTKQTNEKSRADKTASRVQALERSLQDASTKVQDLSTSNDEKDQSIQKLQDALSTYRVEVGKLELLITRLESEHNTALSSLRSEMDEAVADLECHVAAETIGRRAAEAEVSDRDARIKALATRERELVNTVDEKQQFIRETEAAFAEERRGREREVGSLNVQLSSLATNLHESNTARIQAESILESALVAAQAERDAALRALDATREESAAASRNIGGIQDAFVSDARRRGKEVMESQGLLTPSCERFRDVAEDNVRGYVVAKRGRGRGRDSGIEILEEMDEESEDDRMVDRMVMSYE